MIKVNNLSKEFTIVKREAGLQGAIRGLFSRNYEIKKAVDDISFQIEKGEIIGYIGPNGAGKSTTIKMLVGILVPSSGTVEVNGLVPYKNRIENAKRMGVVFGQRTQLWWDIPVSESLNLMRYMYKIPEKQYEENIKLFSEILDIDKFINVPVRQLSLGQRMRADLCAALLHNPDILYLDEPTIGLDVVVKENIREFIKEINKKRKTTVILTTHDISDIEKLCDRVMVIDQGKVMYDGNLQSLKNRYGSEELLRIDYEGELGNLEDIYSIGIDEAKCEGKSIVIKYDKCNVNSSKILSLIMERVRVVDFKVKETEVEEVIRRIYRSATPQTRSTGGIV